MKVDDHLFVDAELCDHVVKKGGVDVVVQVLDRHLHLGRVADVVFVDLENNESVVNVVGVSSRGGKTFKTKLPAQCNHKGSKFGLICPTWLSPSRTVAHLLDSYS